MRYNSAVLLTQNSSGTLTLLRMKKAQGNTEVFS